MAKSCVIFRLAVVTDVLFALAVSFTPTAIDRTLNAAVIDDFDHAAISRRVPSSECSFTKDRITPRDAFAGVCRLVAGFICFANKGAAIDGTRLAAAICGLEGTACVFQLTQGLV